jgi:hypothetical protein
LLAQLARDDAVFDAFPADGVVVVVGGDRTRPKYLPGPTRETRSTVVEGGETIEVMGQTTEGVVTPGPALALGPGKTLPGDVTVRLGDVPQSGVLIAAYAGPASSPSAMREAEAIAATVRPIPHEATVQPVPGSPPPPPNRPGFVQGHVPFPVDRLQPVASVNLPDRTYTVRAEDDCAVVAVTHSDQPVAGGCSARPPGEAAPALVAVASDRMPPPRQGQGSERSGETMLVLLRIASGVDRVTADLVDGRVIDATIGSDGWALVASDGRPFLMEARDQRGQVVARTPVT